MKSSDLLASTWRHRLSVSLLAATMFVAGYAALHWINLQAWIEGRPGLAAWVQAIGSLIGIAIAIAVPAWQRHKASQDVRNAVTVRVENARLLGIKLAGIAVQRLEATRVGLNSRPIGGSLKLAIRVVEADIEVLEAFNLHDLGTAKQMQSFSLLKSFLRSAVDMLVALQRVEGDRHRYAEAMAGAERSLPELIHAAKDMEREI